MHSASAAKTSRLKRQGFTGLLAALLVLMQYPLWFGEGGWLAVRQGNKNVQTQQTLNQRLRERNETLLAEVSDLKQGREAIEERARSELGMIAPDETFIRVMTGPASVNAARPATAVKTPDPVAKKIP
ncbi:MAG: cell division protein FtsB [Thiobacillus sp.]